MPLILAPSSTKPKKSLHNVWQFLTTVLQQTLPVDQKNWLRRLKFESDQKGDWRELQPGMWTVSIVAIGLNLRSLNDGDTVTQRCSGPCNVKASFQCSQKYSVQFSSVLHSCLTLCNPMSHSTPGHPAHHQLPEFTQTYVH